MTAKKVPGIDTMFQVNVVIPIQASGKYLNFRFSWIKGLTEDLLKYS